ncbi:MAG: ATP-dependent DNA helicase [Comamonas sp.]
MPVANALHHHSTLQLRPQQHAMVEAITAAWQAGQPIAIEAPTGTGKTYAYLMAALQRGERFVVSTATRALQDQLVDKDIPVLLAHLQLQRKVAVLKGRENYVCLHGLAQARGAGGQAFDAAAQHNLAQIERWAHSTRSGDLAELGDLRELPRLLPRITASHSECLGRRCAHFDACFSNRARAKAALADVLVINHHLFFSELRHRQMLGAEHGFVPLAATMVLDEAHQLQPIGLKVLARGLNAADIQEFLQATVQHTRWHARGFAPWESLISASRNALQHWLNEQQGADEAMPSSASSLVALHNRLSTLVAALQNVAGGAAVLEQLAAQGDTLLSSLRQWAAPTKPGVVRWWETSSFAAMESDGDQINPRAWRQGFRESPLWLWQALAALRPDVRAATWLPVAVDGAKPGTDKRWLFTSATLGHDDDLQWFTQGLGLGMAVVDASQPTDKAMQPQTIALRLGSHFDWAAQAALVVPQGLPATDAPPAERAAALAQWLMPQLQVLGGRCMVLCTSHAAMQATALALRQGLQASAIGVLVQGEQPKRRLLDTMRSATDSAGYVLVGTMALWEGVDLPGKALQLLVIDKLPFAPRHDVLHAARSAALEDMGLDGFAHYSLPHTAMQLRQGVGRLIRADTDRGVVVIADDRLTRKPYGAALRAALPPMRVLAESEMASYLQHLRDADHLASS